MLYLYDAHIMRICDDIWALEQWSAQLHEQF